MDEIKGRVIKILKRDLGACVDNLSRARRAFGDIPVTEMNEEYGKSGQTPQEIISGYAKSVANVQECIDWVNDI